MQCDGATDTATGAGDEDGFIQERQGLDSSGVPDSPMSDQVFEWLAGCRVILEGILQGDPGVVAVFLDKVFRIGI